MALITPPEVRPYSAGAFVVMVRDYMYEHLAALTGARVTYTYGRIGGLAHDLGRVVEEQRAGRVALEHVPVPAQRRQVRHERQPTGNGAVFRQERAALPRKRNDQSQRRTEEQQVGDVCGGELR